MEILYLFIKFLFYTIAIVLISKYLLVKLLRKLAETLNLKPKHVGDITGVATSVPELLTVIFSSASGLVGASISNILSSNIINTILYLSSVHFNKNFKLLRNKALILDLVLVLITILIPTFMIFTNITLNLSIFPLFILLFILFYFINYRTHKLYLSKEEKDIEKEILEETKWLKGKKRKTLLYTLGLVLSTILLFIIGNALSNVLEELCFTFKIPEMLIGILLGFITSIPELITFFESQKHYKKEHKEIEGVIEATNNLFSSNILNLFIIQSLGILIYHIFYN